MNANQFIKRLQHYLQGKASAQEIHLVDKWYDSFPVHTDIAPLKKAGKEAQLLSAIHLKIVRKKQQATLRKLYVSTARKAAAVLLLASSVTFFWWKHHENVRQRNDRFTVFETMEGGMRKITLPDSSIVWLNAYSKLRFQGSFGDTSRAIYLDEGEAFFDVSANAQKPFSVYTPSLHTLVLGTSFNIKSYQALNFVRVSVATGKVQVAHKGTIYGVFAASQELLYDKQTDKVVRQNASVNAAGAWKNGRVQLYQAGFDELALAVKNLYHLRLKAGAPGIDKLKYTITLESNQSLTDLLIIINAIHETKTRRDANELTMYP